MNTQTEHERLLILEKSMALIVEATHQSAANIKSLCEIVTYLKGRVDIMQSQCEAMNATLCAQHKD